MRIGVISDTHGLLRPEAVTALADAEHILHLGDVGDIAVLDELRTIAPVTAIRGNVDVIGPCALLPETDVLELGSLSLYLLHDPHDLDLKPEAAGFAAVLHGHTHKTRIEHIHGVLYFNPGSAGPRRFSLPVTIGWLNIRNGRIEPSIQPLI